MAIASKVAAKDARLLREKSKKPSKMKANEEEEEEEDDDDDDDDDETPSNSEVETSAQSIKAHDLRKQVQQEELPCGNERKDLPDSNNRMQKRAGHLSNSKTAITSMERKKISNQHLYNQSARFEK